MTTTTTTAVLAIDAPAQPRALLRWIEALGVFILGVALMNYFYAASVARPGDEIGVPEYDSYYHIAMASMLPEHGLLPKFPWLQFVFFRDAGDDFVSHHWGFHLLLLPFVKSSELLTGDALAGGRWAMSAVFGANVLLFHLLLRQRRVPLHWLWIAMFLLLPDQFFSRHGYVRAIGASLMFMQLTLLALFARRYILAAITLAAYVHLYLGAVMYGPVIVAFYAFAQLVAPKDDRVVPWKLVLITAIGWGVGVITYPYVAGMSEFLQMQVFGSGLSPDIEVGREWKPYSDSWFLIQMAAPLFIAWTAALVLRLRLGPRLDAAETTLLLLQFTFLVLTCKARRFIEYWPPMCLLSAAFLAKPVLDSAAAAISNWWAARDSGLRGGAAALGIGTIASIGVFAAAQLHNTPGAGALLAEWRTWIAVCLIVGLPALASIWSAGDADRSRQPQIGRLLAVVIAGGAAFAAVALTIQLAYGSTLPAPRTHVPGVVWGLIAAAYALVPMFAAGSSAASVARNAAPRALRTLTAALLIVVTPTAALAIGAGTYANAARDVRCRYNLADLRELMAFMKHNSREGDVIFTDDWDTFPVFFYHNRHNRYIVGLDPKFTQNREPDLWSRYVRISRGEVPGSIRLASHGGSNKIETAPVDLVDIRDFFRCRYVICDSDHRRLAAGLANAPDLAELVFPVGKRLEQCAGDPYVVFRIRDIGERPSTPAVAKADDQGRLFLSTLRPASVTQGWGDLQSDRSVDGNLIRMHGEVYRRGLGTHAPAKLLYEIPAGADTFRATVGIDDETSGNGRAVVAIYLDGKMVYESPEIRGNSAPVVVNIPLGGAKQIALHAETTADGQRFDHIDWADAHFVVTASTTALATDPPRADPPPAEQPQ